MLAEKTTIYKEALIKKPFALNPTNVFLLSAIHQYLTNYKKQHLTLLDFGGACGAHYFEIKRFIPANISLQWYVVETPQMVKSATEKGLNNDELKFVGSIEDIKTKIDFVHSSGALQYVDKPYEFTNMLLTIGADQVLFNRMMFNENNRDLITVQKSFLSSNGPGPLPQGYTDKVISYPHTTMAWDKFNSMLAKNSYELEWIFEETSGVLEISHEKIIGRGLLYTK